jgi:large subunit ribosomal protein L9
VTSKEISDGLKEQYGYDIPKAKIVQSEPIKSFGTFSVKCKLGYEISATLQVVVSEA